MKKIIFLLAIVLAGFTASAQQFFVRGVIKDSETEETLIGANVLYSVGKGTITDFDGKFSLQLENGEYKITASYVGYQSQTKTIKIQNKNIFVNFLLQSQTIDEVIVVADVARSRETPVAFTNVLPIKIKEELAGKDLPMVLNSTPGVYATQQGGGDGDARITIRGFSQRNVAVMIDGIPVNDMENGWVYWSNWFGLDAITRSMQVQRGLGASKLALPSVGGTMNILTKGIETKRETTIKQSVDYFGKLQTTVGFSSGPLDKGWGFTLAGSYKKGESYVDETGSEGWFYYAKVDKRWGDHITSATAFGAPQEHDQRAYKRSIAAYDLDYAREQGIDVDTKDESGDYIYRPNVNDMGVGYNYHWGYITKDRYNANARPEVLNSKVNKYHKPQFSIRDSWHVNDKLFISNILYLSIGKGGGIGPRHSIKNNQLITDPSNPGYGQIDWQAIYDANTKYSQGPFDPSPVPPTNPEYSNSLYYSSNYLTMQHNEHFWYGYLSSFDYQLTSKIQVSGGIDMRSYTGSHYMQVEDLLGGDYCIDKDDTRLDYMADSSLAMKTKGDKIYYNYNGYVKYGGLFGQIEYKSNNLSTFLNLSTARSGYMKKDFFKATKSDWKWKPSFTIKGGANLNISEHSNIFANLGYLSKTRAFKYFYKGYTTNFQDNTDNEIVKAIEFGYHYASPKFSGNLNTYYTIWENKPTNQVKGKAIDPITGSLEDTYGDIPGMDARHMGVELDFVYKILHNLEFQGLLSLGDWIWDKKIEGLQMYFKETNTEANTIDFDATGIHVGDAAQSQLGASVRYEPIKGLYFNARTTYFARYYADFNPESTTDAEGNPVEPWIMPNYNLIDFHTGYRFHLNPIDKVTFNLRLSVTNILNTTYISDAKNNSSYIQNQYQDFDAKSAEVFFGAPRRFILSLAMKF